MLEVLGLGFLFSSEQFLRKENCFSEILLEGIHIGNGEISCSDGGVSNGDGVLLTGDRGVLTGDLDVPFFHIGFQICDDKFEVTDTKGWIGS